MKLKNEALQKLYDTIVNCTISISPYEGFDSPIDKAFKECDEKLSESVTFEQLKNLRDRIDMLQQDHESDVRVIGKLHSQMVNLEDEKTEQEKRADILKSQRDMLKKEIEQLKKDKQLLEHSRLEWARGAVKRGKEINEANEKNKDLTKQFDELKSQYQKLSIENKRLQYDYNTLHRKYSECQWTVDKQAEQIRNLKAKQDSVRKNCYDQGQTDLWVKLQDVKDMQPNEFDTECECLGDVIDMDLEDFLDEYKKWQEDIKKAYEQKETDRMREWLVDFCLGRVCEGCPLESKEYKCGCGYSFRKAYPSDLRIIPDKDIKRYYEKARGCGQYTLKDAKLFATTVEGVNRAITKACEGFCEAVRDADTKITENLRKGCTFEATVDVDKDLVEKICGVKPEEKKSKPGELVITTRGVTTANYSEATMNAIKEAVRRFEKSLPALDSWESTITGSIKVDDILGKTDNTEHKLEYGDAVRLPWRDYDYMYIGPDEKEETLVHLFDPENHAIVTTHISNVRYNGGRILVSEEDDIRKIWKYMK